MIKNDESKINSGPDQVPENSILNLSQETRQSISEPFQQQVPSVSSQSGYTVIDQDGREMFMNEASRATDPVLTKDRIWSRQPTSKIHNAVAIAESQLLGINRVVRLDIVIEGKIISHFKHFKLRQSAVKHHEFDLMLAYDSLGKPENHNLEEAQNFLGKRITVVFRYKDLESSPERSFVGVITEVGFSQEKGSLGNIVLSGFSPTVLLDAAPHIQSFGGSQEVSLNSIADQVIREGLGQNKFDYRVDAQHGNVSYSSQYEETHYNYLARIAEAYGEQFYYDGEVLHFGKLPPQEKPVRLVYGSSVADIRITMKAQHVNPSFYGYNSSKNEKLTTGSSKINHTSDIARRAYEISEKIFTTPSLRVAPIKAVSFMDIDASQKGTAGSKASDVFVTTGSTTVPFLYPGCIADVEMRKTGSNETAYFTKLMIIATEHEVDSRGYYTGTFEAIASDTGYIPRPEFELPRAEPQFAKVISNTDPLNQGRVQVQFDWQNGSSATEFIRVMTPDGGSSEKVSKNRGFMAIPEVGDQVIINFVHQHPDRPFVMGGMFHGQVGGGGGTGNNIKSLSTRSGNKLELNDGEGSVFLTDQGGAHMKFDGAGNAVTNANNNKTVTVGNDNTVNAGSKHCTDVGKGQSILTMDKNGVIDLNGATKVTLKVGESYIEINAEKIIVYSKDIEVTGQSSSIVKGSGSSKIVLKGDTKITGSQVDIN